MTNVFNFSGGQSSALMTLMNYRPGDVVIFCDTQREHAKTYKFINDFEAFEQIPIIRLAYDGGFSTMLSDRGYKFLPNRVARFCTKELKLKVTRKYLFANSIKKCNYYLGFRADEKSRVLNYKKRYVGYEPIFPLYNAGINKAMVNDFWNKKAYKLEIPGILGNCDLCFLKGSSAIISILRLYPEFATKWIEDEKKYNARYLKDISYSEMLRLAQSSLFKDYDLNEIKPAYSCACTA